jgi:hypothetical protein
MTMRIEIDEDRRWFLPGETVSGRMVWDIDDKLEAVELRLFWHTGGKGTEDVEIVRELRVNAPESRGERRYSFELPLEPYSFSGSLITLAWALELVALPGGELDRSELVVAPTPVEIRLESLGRGPSGGALKLGARSEQP